MNINEQQKQSALEAMLNWLEDPRELGKKPAKIECVKEFQYDEMKYYIFKYKKSALGKWLLGVSGGFEEDSLEECGHTFSEMKEYDESSAVEDATALIETVKEFWKEQAEASEKRKENPGTFVGFVLLKEIEFNKEAILEDLKERWDIEDDSDEKPEDEGSETIIIEHQGVMIVISLMPGPVPEGEVVYNAQKNFMWREAPEAVKGHKGHIMVTVLGRGVMDPVEGGTLFVKAAVTACECEGNNVVGIYSNETVYEPKMYVRAADVINEGMIPLINLVWVGLYNGENGVCGYTCGLNNFGYDEMEVIDSSESPQEVHNLLLGVSEYVISEDVQMNDGETLGFTEDQKLPISKSKAVAFDGDSLKIGF